MAIRFDKDTRRATNGPMIFFSDPSAEISLGDEIRGAIESRLSFYAYRRPGDLMITYGSSEGVVEGIGIPGFVIAPFNPDLPYLTIPYKPVKPFRSSDGNAYSSPARSTTFDEYQAEIEGIKQCLENHGFGKTVAARVCVEKGAVDVGSTFAELARLHPDAFVFCFSTPHTGCWIGASPELLLESSARGLSTMALAGTRPANSQCEWDIKNMEEQQMVTDFISDSLQKNGISPSLGDTVSRRAGKVEHLCTPISGSPANPVSPESLTGLLRDLSPTPALCGTPRDMALKLIRDFEQFDRGCYGGFCGPYRSPSDFSFYVTLRCALVEATKYCIFAGGGITLRSDAIPEWEETEIKSSTMRDSMRLEPNA